MAATIPVVRFLTATFLLEDFKRDLLLCIIIKERRPITESAVTAAPAVVASAAIAGAVLPPAAQQTVGYVRI